MLLGLSGMFERFVQLIPPCIASGLLAGILLQFGISAFGGAKVEPLLVIVLFTTYIVLRRFTSRYAIVGMLVIGLIYLISMGRVDFSHIELAFASPVLLRQRFLYMHYWVSLCRFYYYLNGTVHAGHVSVAK